ncbi:MAG: hypothetical protein ACK4JB_20105 [Reyranella sp.]
MTLFFIGLAFGWLTAAIVVVLPDYWPAPCDRDARDADTEESGW